MDGITIDFRKEIRSIHEINRLINRPIILQHQSINRPTSGALRYQSINQSIHRTRISEHEFKSINQLIDRMTRHWNTKSINQSISFKLTVTGMENGIVAGEILRDMIGDMLHARLVADKFVSPVIVIVHEKIHVRQTRNVQALGFVRQNPRNVAPATLLLDPRLAGSWNFAAALRVRGGRSAPLLQTIKRKRTETKKDKSEKKSE